MLVWVVVSIFEQVTHRLYSTQAVSHPYLFELKTKHVGPLQ